MVNKTEKTLKVVGMHCPSCVSSVELFLTDVDGVDEAKADLDSGDVEVKYNPDKVKDEDLVEAVEEAGFKVE